MTDSEFNRNDPTTAAEVMRELCRSKADQQLVLGQLLRSMRIAAGFGPESCAVTLFRNGFRLNVGRVVAMQFFDRDVSLLLLGKVPAAVRSLGTLSRSKLRSMPEPQYWFSCSIANLEPADSLLEPMHTEYLRAAATASAGPRRSPYTKFHSPGLIEYARRIVGSDGSTKKTRSLDSRRKPELDSESVAHEPEARPADESTITLNPVETREAQERPA